MSVPLICGTYTTLIGLTKIFSELSLSLWVIGWCNSLRGGECYTESVGK